MEKKYIVLDEHINDGDRWESVYDTLEAANKAAEKDWDHLTRYEQARRRISVVVVTRKDLTDDAIDEDGNIDWAMFGDSDRPDGDHFDSAVWYAVLRDREDNDWGNGSRYKTEAIEMALEHRVDGDAEAYVVVISDGPDPVALEELHDLDAELARAANAEG